MRVYFMCSLYHADIKDGAYRISLVRDGGYIGKYLLCMGNGKLYSVPQQ